MRRLLAGRRESGFALVLFVILLAVNVLLNPVRFLPASWGTEIGLAAPLVAAAVATMPAMLGGRGGIDVSVGPLMGFVNAVLVQVLPPCSPASWSAASMARSPPSCASSRSWRRSAPTCCSPASRSPSCPRRLAAWRRG
jgi:ribose/xylose/arabinose/galactoside ABC-type transport system permease subunit